MEIKEILKQFNNAKTHDEAESILHKALLAKDKRISELETEVEMLKRENSPI